MVEAEETPESMFWLMVREVDQTEFDRLRVASAFSEPTLYCHGHNRFLPVDEFHTIMKKRKKIRYCRTCANERQTN